MDSAGEGKPRGVLRRRFVRDDDHAFAEEQRLGEDVAQDFIEDRVVHGNFIFSAKFPPGDADRHAGGDIQHGYQPRAPATRGYSDPCRPPVFRTRQA